LIGIANWGGHIGSPIKDEQRLWGRRKEIQGNGLGNIWNMN
jgi:hypothetical protein